jgi:hypothetical protein
LNENLTLMKIIIPTQQAEVLKNKMFKSVEDEILKTWIIRKDADGKKYLTHKPDQWYDLALLAFTVKTNQLDISITWWNGKEPNEDIKGYYVGRFVEILLVHFKDAFTTFTVNP